MCTTRWPSVYHQWYTVVCILPTENTVPEYQNLQTHLCENNKNCKSILQLSRTVLTLYLNLYSEGSLFEFQYIYIYIYILANLAEIFLLLVSTSPYRCNHRPQPLSSQFLPTWHSSPDLIGWYNISVYRMQQFIGSLSYVRRSVWNFLLLSWHVWGGHVSGLCYYGKQYERKQKIMCHIK